MNSHLISWCFSSGINSFEQLLYAKYELDYGGAFNKAFLLNMEFFSK